MPSFPNVEAFVLVGGKSSRMGRDKALLELNGQPLIQRTADILNSLVAITTLVISARHPDQPVNTNPYSNFELPTLADRWPNVGPLGGIVTALAAAQTSWCVILACDMPFITTEWITYLLGRIAESESNSDSVAGIDVIIPKTERGLEPLCAIYRTSCAPNLTVALGRGIRQITSALAELNLKAITEDEWRRFSPDGNLFGNLNTWADYLAAQKRFKA